MRVMVTGSRDWTDGGVVYRAMVMVTASEEKPRLTTLVVGDAEGADALATRYAGYFGWGVEVFHAAWARYGKAAGPLRNLDMLNSKPDLVLAFRLGGEESRGTTHAVTAARKQGVPVILFDYPRQ